MRLHDVRRLLARLPAPPGEDRGAARLAAPHAAQPALLPRPHGDDAAAHPRRTPSPGTTATSGDALARGDEENPPIPPISRRRRGRPRTSDRFEIRVSEHGWASVRRQAVGRDHARGTRSDGRGAGALRRAVAARPSACASRSPRRSSSGTSVWARPTTPWRRSGAARRRRRTRSGRSISSASSTTRVRSASRCATRRAFRTCSAPPRTSSCASANGGRRSATLTWTLLEGDFRSRLTDAPTPDVHLLRPVLGQTDREMWTLDCFEERVRGLRRPRHRALHLLGVDRRAGGAPGSGLPRRSRRRDGAEGGDDRGDDTPRRAPSGGAATGPSGAGVARPAGNGAKRDSRATCCPTPRAPSSSGSAGCHSSAGAARSARAGHPSTGDLHQMVPP